LEEATRVSTSSLIDFAIPYNGFSFQLLMSEDKIGFPNDQDRRKGEDRRKGDRRDQERGEEKGVLTTRTGEDRRKHNRRAEDRQPEDTAVTDESSTI
jgi:hypothetical protein